MKVNQLKGKIGAMLSIKHCPEKLRKEILDEFTFDNPAFEQAARFSPWGTVSPKIPRKIKLAYQVGSETIFPRGVAATKLVNQYSYRRVRWTDLRKESPARFPVLLIGLTSEQRELYDGYLKSLKKEDRPFGNYLFVSPTSSGKTIFLFALARALRQKVLVLCLTDLIFRSWKADLIKAFGLKEKEIGVIRRNTWRIGNHFTLASIQTLARREKFWESLSEEIGTVICDEAHTSGAPSIHRFLLSSPAKYIIGVTATDKNERGVNPYVRACFGAPVKRLLPQDVDTETSMVLRRVELIPTAFTFEYHPLQLDWHQVAQAISADEKRNQLIVDTATIQVSKDHIPLVVTKSVAHVHLLHSMFEDKGLYTRMLTGETNTDKKYTEKTLKDIFAREVQCVVATIQAVKLGANLNPLDQLHLAMPVANKKDLEQLIGRIRRKWEGKKDCAVYYYLDINMPYLNHLYGRVGCPVFRKLKVAKYQNLYVV